MSILPRRASQSEAPGLAVDASFESTEATLLHPAILFADAGQRGTIGRKRIQAISKAGQV